ncbi:hypothetical protein E2562_019635 [Oryza meyeriana var. granulata]|uniref:Uncharacterized protein n=1 Tax=Oryza meyeriana var. granulata TaxID=110450 RepID=A0A6G1C823_9ORYZ|nr:hypothetical protein E2562_019635 [Oryza meyeriana var. granulata]
MAVLDHGCDDAAACLPSTHRSLMRPSLSPDGHQGLWRRLGQTGQGGARSRHLPAPPILDVDWAAPLIAIPISPESTTLTSPNLLSSQNRHWWCSFAWGYGGMVTRSKNIVEVAFPAHSYKNELSLQNQRTLAVYIRSCV